MLGKLKSETGANLPVEVVCLAPKCYSIKLTNNDVKSANKGVPAGNQKELTHDKFLGIYRDEISLMKVKVTSIVSTHCNVRTKVQTKRCLSKIDDKRHYVDCNKTLAYGHPDIL